jgi:hypothetical protein
LDTIQERSIEASNDLSYSALKNSERKRQSLYNPNNPYNSSKYSKGAIYPKNPESQNPENKIGNPFEDHQNLNPFYSSSQNLEIVDLKVGSVRTDLLGVDLLRAKRKIDLLESRVYDIENSQQKS